MQYYSVTRPKSRLEDLRGSVCPKTLDELLLPSLGLLGTCMLPDLDLASVTASSSLCNAILSTPLRLLHVCIPGDLERV